MRPFCFAILFFLGGCASVAWTKPGATAEEFAVDQKQCQEDAWREANSLYLDRTYLYGGRWIYPDPLGRPFVGYPSTPYGDPFGERYIHEARLTDFCMRAKGYELTQVQK